MQDPPKNKPKLFNHYQQLKFRSPDWSITLYNCCLPLQGGPSNTAVAIQVISSNISASTYLASLSITITSIIGTWVGSSSSQVLMDTVIYGDTSPSTSSVKFITLLSFFLVAFTSFVQSARYFLHASFLMSMPDSDIPVSYVQKAVIRGSNFWSVGLRALYVATTLVLWIFGPIPMFACSLSTVVVLYFLDSNSNPLHKYSPPLGQGPGKMMRRQQNNKTLGTYPMSTQSSNISWGYFHGCFISHVLKHDILLIDLGSHCISAKLCVLPWWIRAKNWWIIMCISKNLCKSSTMDMVNKLANPEIQLIHLKVCRTL